MIYFFTISIFFFGLIIGSFLNALIYRMHENVSMMGRSFCPQCKHQIAWYDNVPVFSFLFLGGECRYCKKKISWQYPLVELTTGALFALAFYLNSTDLFLLTFNFQLLTFLRDLFFISIMIIVFIYDLKWFLILDRITLPAMGIIFLLNIILGYSWVNLFFGALFGGGFFLFQFLVSRGRWIGGGDIRLGLLMGLMFSWPMILVATFLAYLIGSVISVFLLIFGKKKWDSQVPLGIFLTTSSIFTLFWGSQILSWYLNLIY